MRTRALGRPAGALLSSPGTEGRPGGTGDDVGRSVRVERSPHCWVRAASHADSAGAGLAPRGPVGGRTPRASWREREQAENGQVTAGRSRLTDRPTAPFLAPTPEDRALRAAAVSPWPARLPSPGDGPVDLLDDVPLGVGVVLDVSPGPSRELTFDGFVPPPVVGVRAEVVAERGHAVMRSISEQPAVRTCRLTSGAVPFSRRWWNQSGSRMRSTYPAASGSGT